MDNENLLDRLQCMTAYSCIYDRRFSYYIYLPKSFGTENQPEKYQLLVLIHGSERSAEQYRNKFKAFADKNQCAILSPLFPADISEETIENYIYLRSDDTEYDTVLLNMIDEFASFFPVQRDNILLHGFSAGGQFVHRFYYLYSHKLAALSIGSVGYITPIDDSEAWPVGTKDFKEHFLHNMDLEKMQKVPVQIVIGENDGYTHDGYDRQVIVRKLRDNYKSNEICVQLDTVPNAGHNGFKLINAVTSFFERVLARNIEL